MQHVREAIQRQKEIFEQRLKREEEQMKEHLRYVEEGNAEIKYCKEAIAELEAYYRQPEPIKEKPSEKKQPAGRKVKRTTKRTPKT